MHKYLFPKQFKLCTLNATIQYEEHQACSDHVSYRNESNIAMTTQLNNKDMDVHSPGDVLRSPELLPLHKDSLGYGNAPASLAFLPCVT